MVLFSLLSVLGDNCFGVDWLSIQIRTCWRWKFWFVEIVIRVCSFKRALGFVKICVNCSFLAFIFLSNIFNAFFVVSKISRNRFLGWRSLERTFNLRIFESNSSELARILDRNNFRGSSSLSIGTLTFNSTYIVYTLCNIWIISGLMMKLNWNIVVSWPVRYHVSVATIIGIG